jgi:hypothetical protein
MSKIQRIIIYPKDVAIITGRSVKYGRKTLGLIKKKLNKEAHHPVTVNEYCEHFNIKVDEVVILLN